MKAEGRILGGLGLFLVPWTALYWLAAEEHAGAVALTAVVAALGFVAVYLHRQARLVGERPEDRPDADPAESVGEVGTFAGSSPWPPVMGAAAALTAYGLVFSRWLAVPGLALLLLAVAGYAAEVQRAGRSGH